MPAPVTISRQQQRIETTRNTILDAAVALYQSQGIKATNISEIITASGLGRTTFYRYFKDQDEILNQAIIRDYTQLMDDYQAQQFAHDNAAVQIVDGLMWFNRQLRTRPALALLFQDPTRALFDRLDLSLETFHEFGQACTRPFYDLAHEQGLLREGVSLEKCVRWCTFVLVSLQTSPYPLTDNEFELRDMLRDFLVPSLMSIDEV